MRRVALWFVMLLCLGCSNAPQDRPKLGKVSGLVTINQIPLANGIISFVPDADHGTKGPAATGGIGPDGKFVLRTKSPGDGAVIGFHRVSIEAYESAESFDPANPQMAIRKPSIPKRYFDVSTSELTAEVKPGSENSFNFELHK